MNPLNNDMNSFASNSNNNFNSEFTRSLNGLSCGPDVKAIGIAGAMALVCAAGRKIGEALGGAIGSFIDSLRKK